VAQKHMDSDPDSDPDPQHCGADAVIRNLISAPAPGNYLISAPRHRLRKNGKKLLQ